VLAGGFYLYHRYEVIRLPEGGRSPLLRLAPGMRLWLDRRPPTIAAGDVVFFELEGGKVGFAEVERVDGEGETARYWVVTDAPDVEAQDSDELGWLHRDSIQARLMMATDF